MATSSESQLTEDVFNEDVVYRYNKKGNIQYGLVLENSEMYSSDDDNSDSDNGGPRLKTGFVRVAWHPKGSEEVIQQKRVGLADRSLMPGDVVQKMVRSKGSQRGYCRTIDMNASVQIIGTNMVITSVKSSKLVPLEEYSPDILVCLDSWIGAIRQVNMSLHLKFSDGSKCVVSNLENCSFEDADEKSRRDGEFYHADYYPGQMLVSPLISLSKANWLNISKELKASLRNAVPGKTANVCVEKVQVDSLNVHWQCKAYSKASESGEKEQPTHLVEGDQLKRLKMINIFEPCSLQIGDRNYYTIESGDVIVTKDNWRRSQKEIFPAVFKGKSKVFVKKKKEEDSTLAPPPQSSSTNSSPTHSTHSNPAFHQVRKADADDWDTDETGSFSDTASLSSNCSNSSQGPAVQEGYKTLPLLDSKKKKGPALMTRVLKTKKLRRARKNQEKIFNMGPGDRVVVETLSTSSLADVVWQDGQIERRIPSTQLYPIHHLDDKEFFPGDFVVENKEDAFMQVYGVVQSVDHAGRTSKVKWFKTYSSSDNPMPSLLDESEVSVYDLKDHPDFQYRPGTVVIRVANFEGEDASCTAGQVLDNYPEGKVQVWWVDEHVSMCWPQDLYRVGEYDSDDGELWDTAASDASWETESEDCHIADDSCSNEGIDEESLKPKLDASIEKARIAMSRLEEIFTHNPNLQTSGVMKQLLDIYKDCRYLDKLMCTSFFHESHFQGLLERVRERGRSNLAQRMADQVTRLFCSGESVDQTTLSSDSTRASDDSGCMSTSKEAGNSSPSDSLTSEEFLVCDPNLHKRQAAAVPGDVSATVSQSGQDGSGKKTSEDSNTVNVCVKLCNLIKCQLLSALEEVTAKYGGQISLSLPDLQVSPPSPAEAAQNCEKDTEVEESTVPNGCCEKKSVFGEGFFVEESSPNNHKFKLTTFQPTEPKVFFQTINKEHNLLRTSLPDGVCVKAYEDRMDLYSVMIKGPAKTPYEDGVFFFDFQLSVNYPKAPPICHYISYCSDRLNPNLYEDGKVCVSLLGTWSGKGTEVWTANSTLLQVIVSIQGLILVSEPYFNEAGYEKQKGSQQGRENSRMYNEMVVLKQVQALTKMLLQPPSVFKEEVLYHFKHQAYFLIDRLEGWLKISEMHNDSHPLSPVTPTTFREAHGVLASSATTPLPEFPLIPASKGFCITLRKSLSTFQEVLTSVGILRNVAS
ncbi:(E3-independent) E2 ubiquitin-conjugating enzyme isoform X2 [Cloeon dipterum]|uniref:(E3-independent) E2 ubiquitin-conjugating enzyme isoform X2 n=1 Tax=Cloeon dipterum TaxID=197152 RepID=UPI00321FF6B0